MKLNKAAVIAGLPDGWELQYDGDIILYQMGDAAVQHEFSGNNLISISHFLEGELHRDPVNGPAYIWWVGDQVYEKYFFAGLPAASPAGHYGVVKKDDGSVLLTY
jgi:hypothetical protein